MNLVMKRMEETKKIRQRLKREIVNCWVGGVSLFRCDSISRFGVWESLSKNERNIERTRPKVY